MTDELRIACRSLLGRRAFVAASVATLALGIGAATLVFGLVDGVLLEPLPYPASDRIGVLWHELHHGAQSLPVIHPLDLRDYESRARSFEVVTFGIGSERILSSGGRPETVAVGVVAWNFLNVFDGEPSLGRFFRPDEDVFGGPKLAVLSHDLWRARFGAATDIVGRTVELDHVPYQVIGVASPGFELHLPRETFLLRDPDIWVSAQLDWQALSARTVTAYTGFVRLSPGVSFDDAQKELEVLAAQLRSEHAVHAATDLRARVVPLHLDVTKHARRGLSLLMVAVGLVLLVACGNVSQLTMVQSRERERAFALRLAVGAGRGALFRAVLLESALLSIGGAVVGLWVARAGLQLAIRLAEPSLPRMASVAVDGSVFGFALAVAALSAFGFGLIPAIRVSRTDVVSTLTNGGGTKRPRSKLALRSVLIAVEVASAVALTVNAALLLDSYLNLRRSRPGFEPSAAVTMSVSLPKDRVADARDPQASFDELTSRLRTLPGVAKVGTVNQLPLTGVGGQQHFATESTPPGAWGDLSADRRFVDEGFLDAIGGRLVAGRWFQSAEVRERRPSVVIDERLAAIAFPAGDAIGARMQIDSLDTARPFAEVIGVVEHLNLRELESPGLPQLFRPGGGRRRHVVVRSSTADVANSLRGALREQGALIAPGAAFGDPVLLDALIVDATASERLGAWLVALFGLATVGLAAVGVYGVIASELASRARELGIRAALGASPKALQASVAKEIAGPFLLGLVAGWCLAVIVARVFSSLLHGVSTSDPVTLVFVGAGLAVVAFGAAWLPARTLSTHQPLAAIRHD